MWSLYLYSCRQQRAMDVSINAPMAHILAYITVGFVGCLGIRHLFNLSPRIRGSGLGKQYLRVERYFSNKLAYTILPRHIRPTLPPLGAILIVVVFFCCALPILLVRNNLRINSNRAGYMVLTIVPFLMSCTGKHSAFALITGMSPVKLNFFHRLLGFACVIFATVHMACMLQQWSKFPSFLASNLATDQVKYGLSGYGCLCLVFLGAQYPFRRFCYEAFLGTHLFAFGFIGAIAKHSDYAMNYFAAGIICYGLNAFVGLFVKSRLARANVEALPNGCTRLQLRMSSPVLHRPGQHIYIMLPKISYIQWHPFTITNTFSDKSGGGIVVELHATVRGNFTRSLYQKADGQDWVAFVSGPCGNGSYDLEPQYILKTHKKVLLMNAGAGVTFGIRLLRELSAVIQENPMDTWVTRDIYFCWTVRNAGELEWFKRELESHIMSFGELSSASDKVPRIHVHLYATRSADGSMSPIEEEKFADFAEVSRVKQEYGKRMQLSAYLDNPDGLQMGVFGKFDVANSQCRRLTSESNMNCTACGPKEFNAEIKNLVASQTSLKSVPHLHCESFEY